MTPLATMKIFLFCLLVWLGIGCRKNDSDPSVLAIVDYSLPGDGCDWNVRIGDSTYLPSQRTVSILIDFARKQRPESFTFYDTVKLHYQPTLIRRTVNCGWGRTLTASEIDVFEVRAR